MRYFLVGSKQSHDLLQRQGGFTINVQIFSLDISEAEDFDRAPLRNSGDPGTSAQGSLLREPLASDVISALGSDPSAAAPQGHPLHEEIVVRWTSYLQMGLEKNIRADLLAKYPLSSNCAALHPPKLNAEVQPCLLEAPLKQDLFLSHLQHQIATGLSALGGALDTLIQQPLTDPSKEQRNLLPQLADAAQLFADVHHSISMHRRFLLTPLLNADCKKVIDSCNITENLFGTNFQDKVKSSQALKKTAAEMRAQPLPKKKTTIPRQPSSSSQAFLNSKRLQTRPRWKGRTEVKRGGANRSIRRPPFRRPQPY